MNLFAANASFAMIVLFISLAYCIYKAKKWAKDNPEATGAAKKVILDQIKKKLGG